MLRTTKSLPSPPSSQPRPTTLGQTPLSLKGADVSSAQKYQENKLQRNDQELGNTEADDTEKDVGRRTGWIAQHPGRATSSSYRRKRRSSVKLEGRDQTHDVDSDDAESEGGYPIGGFDGNDEVEDERNWLDLDTRVSTPDSTLLLSPPQSQPVLGQQAVPGSTPPLSNEEEYHLLSSGSLQPLAPTPSHSTDLVPGSSSGGVSLIPSLIPSDDVAVVVQETRVAQGSSSRAVDHKRNERRRVGSWDEDPMLMDAIMRGIGRMTVTMRMDDGGRWRIARQRSQESFVAEDLL